MFLSSCMFIIVFFYRQCPLKISAGARVREFYSGHRRLPNEQEEAMILDDLNRDLEYLDRSGITADTLRKAFIR